MHRRTTASLTIAAIGTGLLVAAALGTAARATPDATGGTLRVDVRSDFDYVDPALAFFVQSWQVENATCDKLLGFPDAEGDRGSRLRPQVASAMPTVSHDGRTYVFRLRRGLRFSTGAPVTADSFVYAWNRAMNPALNAPAQPYMDDIVGAKAVLSGQATEASGLRARDAATLEVTLTRASPDFLSRVTMPFFCPLPVGTPIVAGGIDAPVPGNGPYFLKDWTKRRAALVVRNPYYGGTRNANVDEIAYTFGNSLEASRLRLERGDVDLGPVPPAATAELIEKYGLNKERFFVKKALQLSFLALNHRRPLFAGNDRLKRALNYAIDRPQIARQFGLLGAARTDQILPSGMPGYRDWYVYPLKGANVARARRELRTGDLRSGNAILYAGNAGADPLVAQIIQYNAKQIGLSVEIKLFDAIVRTEKMRNPDEAFDMGTLGWIGPFLDPSVFVDTLLGPDTIASTNLSYFRDAQYSKRIRAAALLVGDERYRAYAQLDRELMTGPAPIVPYVNTTLRVFVSARVKNFKYNPAAPGGVVLNAISVQ